MYCVYRSFEDSGHPEDLEGMYEAVNRRRRRYRAP